MLASDVRRVAGARRLNVTRAAGREVAREGAHAGTERPSVLRAQLDRAPDRDAAHHVYRPPHPHHVSGTPHRLPEGLRFVCRHIRCLGRFPGVLLAYFHLDMWKIILESP